MHPSDSSSFHYLYQCIKETGKENFGYCWIASLCDKYYGLNGLFSEKYPPGYETLNLFRAKVRNNYLEDKTYYEEQSKLEREVKFLIKDRKAPTKEMAVTFSTPL